jgi:hypothetical protein
MATRRFTDLPLLATHQAADLIHANQLGTDYQSTLDAVSAFIFNSSNYNNLLENIVANTVLAFPPNRPRKITINAAAGDISLTIPAASVDYKTFNVFVKRTDTSVNTVSVLVTGGSTYTLLPGDWLLLSIVWEGGSSYSWHAFPSAYFLKGTNERRTINWTTGVDNIKKTGFYFITTDLTNLPTAAEHYLIHINDPDDDTHSVQIACAIDTSITYNRANVAGVWSSWSTQWGSLNDGPGSGLDADTLDGYHASQIQQIADKETILSVDTVLTTSGKYRATLPINITLPASLTEGDRIEIFTEKACKILQADAQAGISFLNKYWTTKGVYVPTLGEEKGYIHTQPMTRILLTYKGSGFSRIEPFVKVADPTTLPGRATTPGGVAFSKSAKYLAVGSDLSDYLYIYKRSGNTFTYLPGALSVNPLYPVRGLAFSPDDNYLAVSQGASPGIIIYKIDHALDFFTKIADPAILPPNNVWDVAWSKDSILACGSPNSPYLAFYSQIGDVFTKLANPTTLPTGGVRAIAWNREGTLFSAAHSTSPYFSCYKRTGTLFTKLNNPAILPSAQGQGVSFIKRGEGEYLAVGHANSPRMSIYAISHGEGLVKINDIQNMPSSDVQEICTSNDNRYLIVSSVGFAFYIYKDSLFTKLNNPVVYPSEGYHVDISDDGFYFAVNTITGAPDLFIYTTVEAISKSWIVEELTTLFEFDPSFMFK